jgi:hypothetical protein
MTIHYIQVNLSNKEIINFLEFSTPNFVHFDAYIISLFRRNSIGFIC